MGSCLVLSRPVRKKGRIKRGRASILMSAHKGKWSCLIPIRKLVNEDSCGVLLNSETDTFRPEGAEASQLVVKGSAG